MNLQEQKQKQENFDRQQMDLISLRQSIHKQANLAQKERMLIQIKALRKIKAPTFDENRIPELEAKIKELQLADKIKNQEKQLKLVTDVKNSSNGETLFTGFVILVILTEKQFVLQKRILHDLVF